MDSHPHSSIGRSNTAGSTLFQHEINAKSVILNTLTNSSNLENSNPPSISNPHHLLHHHHQNHHHHPFVDSSSIYHHPYRTVTPNSAEKTIKILDHQSNSKSSTPTQQSSTQTQSQSQSQSQTQTQSRPNSGSTVDWPVTGIIPPSVPAPPPPTRRPFSSGATLETSTHRDSPATSGGASGNYDSSTTTTLSRRSSSNPNPNVISNPNELVPSANTTPTPTATPSYYQQQQQQQHPTKDNSNLNMMATINCTGYDVRPVYGSEDSRQTSSTQNPSQAHSDIPSPSHTRVPTSEELRETYYGTHQSSPYGTLGTGMLPSHYPHVSPSMSSQPRSRRASSSMTGGHSAYNPYTNLSVSVSAGSSSYPHHRPHHSDAQVVSNWSPSVDSVRNSVSPYIRPSRQPSATHTPSTSFPHSIRNGQLLNSQNFNNHPNTAPHPTGTMQYNAQGRPLAYMCNTCFRAFDRPSALQIHERSHTGERPFPCPWNGCVKRFTTHGNMVKHSRVCPFREPED